MEGIPLVDLKPQFQELNKEILGAIQVLLGNTDFILGQDVERFESEFADFVGVDFAVGVASGTDALMLMLKGCGVEPGDEVILPANTFVATAYAVSHCGARPVLADVAQADFNLDVNKVSSVLTDKTKAILPVHLYGRVADMAGLKEISESNGVPILEDACQAHGATYLGECAGALGRAAAFSFFPGKNLGGCGDGGMITTNDEAPAQKIRMLRNYGQSKKYRHDFVGYNSRLDTIQAAILRVKLPYLDAWNQRRRELADLYRRSLAEVPVTLPSVPEEGKHVYHLFVVRTGDRDALLRYLQERGIGAGIHYPVPIHLHSAYEHLGYRVGDFPVSEKLCAEILSLPVYPEMSDDQVLAVVAAIKDFFRER
jgi:dTDP-3-amino-3,4,6-trideoxy-alpha-D-glucose transaminase